MLKYTIKRLIFGLATIFIVSTLTFFLMQQVPGGPFAADKSISKAAQKALEVKYGLDKPITVQYVNYFKNALRGDFGISIKQRGRDVAQIISSKFPVSARVGGISIILALMFGVPLGSIAALNRGKVLDRLIIMFATLGIAVPSFVVCTILMYTLGVKLELLPTYNACIGTFILPYSLYCKTDEVFNVGCTWTGLYENSKGKRTFRECYFV